MSKIEIGSRVVIVVSEHARNLGRLCKVIEPVKEATGPGWALKCVNGGDFDGFEVYAHDTTRLAGGMVARKTLGVAEWKLCLESEVDAIEKRLVTRDEMQALAETLQ